MAQAGHDQTPKKRARGAATPDWAPAFLEAFGERGMVSHAAEAAGVGRSTVYDRRERDPDFRAAWDDVVDRSTDVMEREAMHRAVVGVEKPVFQRGEEVGRVREYSDTLLIFLLKARKPLMYRERVEHSGAGGGPIAHRHKLDLSQLSDEELAVLRKINASRRSADPGD